MEEIYVVKLKTRPGTSSLYPSERRYSASTVGGLGLVHLLLCATLLVLATLGMASEEADARGRYAGAIALGLAAGVAAGVALLAWRRWYVDNNIRHFLVASSVGAVVSLVCLCLTSLALASVQEEISTRYLYARLVPTTTSNASRDVDLSAAKFQPPAGRFDSSAGKFDSSAAKFDSSAGKFDSSAGRFDSSAGKFDSSAGKFDSSAGKFDSSAGKFDSSAAKFDVESSTPSFERGADGNDTADLFAEDGVEEALAGATSNETANFEARGRDQWIYNYESFQEIRNVVLINVLVASLLELAWCLLSMRISWRGVNNVYSDSDEPAPSTKPGFRKNKFLPDERRLRSPDIIHNLAVNVVSNENDQYLPKGESTVEYEDRVRKFLASNDSRVHGNDKH